MAIRSIFQSGILTGFGDSLDSLLALSRSATGQVLFSAGGIPVPGATPGIAETTLLQVFGRGGKDSITVDEANGPMPPANLFGGAGDDSLAGGSAADLLFGQAGSDLLLGQGGADLLFGGAGDDTLVGGDGEDQLFGQAGNDLLIWNPGDDTDLFEGGSGIDTTLVNGGNGAESFAATANGPRVRLDRLDPAPFAVDMGGMEALVVNMNGGDDAFSATGNLAALIAITVDGGAGNDTILGGNGADLLIGGDGNDVVDGQQGNDTILLGAGDDLFQWDPGDGSDTVEGQDGSDRMLFNGSAGAERMTASAQGGRVVFTRDLGNITMDLDGVETLAINALGGPDTIVLRDLRGTDITAVDIDLAGAIGGTAGDGEADLVTAAGGDGDEVVALFGAGSGLSLVGLAAAVNIVNLDGAQDALQVDLGAGDDRLAATAMAAGAARLSVDGGAGNDTLLGSQGADTLIGGEGNDVVFGDNGDDIAFLGAGDDVFQWDPGDGSDVVEGQQGTDRLLFVGSGVAETVTIAANGGRALFQRDVAAVTMDLNEVEQIEFRALGGADTIVVGDLTGTAVTSVALDLRGPGGSGDAAADSVTAHGRQAAEKIVVAGDAAGIQLSGLAAQLLLAGAEGALDGLVVKGQGGDDVIDAGGLAAGAARLVLDGGLGADLLLGSAGDDLFIGGDGNDTALMGAGNDTFVWNPGDDSDVLEGQDGSDSMLFNGANIAETITIAADGGRVSFLRDIAAVRMDLNDVETIAFNALGGADTIRIDDLGGTDVTEVAIDLGGGDGQADSVFVRGTAGDDVVVVAGGAAGEVLVLGLAATLRITGFGTGDRLVIEGLAGDDVIDASGLAAGTLLLTAQGGEGDDVLIGGDGNDLLSGDAGDDVLLGGPGIDILNGGIGDNILIQ